MRTQPRRAGSALGVLAVLLAAGQVLAADVVTDGDMELTGYTNWPHTNLSGTNTSAKATDQKGGGTWSLKGTSQTGRGVAVSWSNQQSVGTINTGSTVTLSLWYGIRFYASTQQAGGTLFVESATNAGGPWTQLWSQAVTPNLNFSSATVPATDVSSAFAATATYYLRLRFSGTTARDNAAYIAVWWDNVVLDVVGPPVSTAAGTASASSSGCNAIAVSATYTNDSNLNNTLSYRYRTPSGSGAWVGPIALGHSASPYAFNISGLTFNATYDVEVTYVDGDTVTGTNPQTVSNILVGATCTGAGTVTAVQTSGATPSIAVSGPYTGDSGGNNTASYRYRVSPAGGWIGPTNLGHSASPYTATISSLTCGTAYDVEFTYADANGIGSGTAVQTVSNILLNNCSVAGAPTAVVNSCTQITVSAPHGNDANGNGTTSFSRGPSGAGPWTSACAGVSGASPRICVDNGVLASSTYYYQVTYGDADAVGGTAVQVIGPFNTGSCSQPALTTGVPGATVDSCSQITVSAPFTGDTNGSSNTLFERGPSGTGPWTAACSNVIGASPRSCPASGLSNASPYYFRVTFADADGVNGTNPQVIGPFSTFDCTVTPGVPTASADSCTQITASAPFAGDYDGDSTSAFARGPSGTGPWTAVAGCGAIVGASPRSCVDIGVSASSSYYFQVTYADADGVNGTNPVVTAGATSTPACAAVLTVSSVAVTGGNVAAGSIGTVVGRLVLSSSAGSVTVTGLNVANTGTALADTDVQALLLYDDANSNGMVDTGEALLGVSSYSTSLAKYVFSGLTDTVTAPTSRTALVVMNLALGARAGLTFAMRVTQADVTVSSPNTVAATNFPMSGNLFTIVAGAFTEGDPTANTLKPMALIVNPGNGSTVSSDPPAGTTGFRVQAQIYSPSALTSVTLSTDDGTTFPTTLAKNANYGGGANDGIWEATAKLAPGSYLLRVRATNGAGFVDSGKIQIVVNAKGVGDGNLLVRDNSSQLCVDCHAIKTHSSQATSTQYGSWAVSCLSCHTPHGSTNIYLVKNQITPPAVTGVQSAKTVKFSTTTGATSSTAIANQTFVNEADNSGPCQVCHTRTQSKTALARWRNTGNADTHYTSVATQPCTSCHGHAGGFAAGESGGKTDCTSCHNGIFTAMSSITVNHHHFQYQGWSGTTSGSGLTVYPTAVPTSSQTDINRRCLMCHVDHDLFRPDLNASGGRGKNLRTDITLTPTATTNFTNTDFDSALTNGGICVSCHQTALTKAYPDPAGTTTTPIVAKAEYTGSAHNYGAANTTSTFADTLTNTFLANCSKCHNDTMAKSYQTSAAPRQYTLHDSTLRSMTAPLGVTTPADPLEESFCYQCHRRSTDALTGSSLKPAAGMDYYNALAMTPQSELLYNVFTNATYAFDHPLATSGIHKVTGEGAAANDGSLSGANRHVSCADCHDPHGSKSVAEASGSVTAFVAGTAPVFDTLTDNTKTWTANQWRGYSVRILSGTGAGQASTVFGNTGTVLSVEFATALAAGATYVIVNEGRSTGATSPAYTAPIGPVTGAWGLSPTWPTPPAPPNWNDQAGCGTAGTSGACAPITSQFASITTWNRVETPTLQGQMCIKCHSAYAYGATPPNTPSAQPNSTKTVWSNTVSAATMPQGDKANEFNPNNLGHHAVFARGKNQPVLASYGQTGVTSVVNANWPKYSTATDNVTVTAGAASFAGAAALPATALPGWYLYIGSDTLPVTTPAAGTATTGFLEITAISSSTSFAVRACADAACSTYTTAITIAATPNWAVTAGLGNNFVPPWGPWSILQCSDCHTSDTATDPYGPHGSSTKWLLRKAVAQAYRFFNGASVVAITGSPSDANNFCVNCHRRDVYGDYNFFPTLTCTSPCPTVPGAYARQGHPPDSGDQASLQDKPKWGINCMNCHGGARVGGIHGQNLGLGVNGTAGSYSGKRLLAGSTWYGVTRSTTTLAGRCWTKGTADAVDNCAHSHNGTSMQSGVAKYNYDTNP